MILLTGGYGFVGRHLAKALEAAGDRFVISDPRAPHSISVENVISSTMAAGMSAVFHFGAISDTTCEDWDALNRTNILLPQRIWHFCAEKKAPFIYASSGSVYGNKGQPLNSYAASKFKFDCWMQMPPQIDVPWYGLRFMNVYGKGEDHKGKQASIVSRLLSGDLTEVFEPQTTRDFVHVSDCVEVARWMLKTLPPSGIYDVGTGVSRSILDVVAATGRNVREIPMPESLKGKYQFHTQADLTKLRQAGYDRPFLSLEEGIARMRS